MKRKIKKRRNGQEYNPEIEPPLITTTFPKLAHVWKSGLNESHSYSKKKNQWAHPATPDQSKSLTLVFNPS